ncbi:MAG: CCA tRNA nucleotidyltransferase [Ectobacillus sp.]
MEQFKEAASIIKTLKKNGYEAYFVGGSVRDYLIGRPIGDIDIATSALPQDVMRLFPRHVPVGLEHGTVIVLHKEIPYEVTTFRIESGYEDFRRPSAVTFVRLLKEDLQRRDFTMNAIAMTEQGEIVDPFAGREAIFKRQIETVGNPHERFQEDALRMMRGIRFVSTLGFTLTPLTKQAIADHVALLDHIAIERIAAEFEKLLTGQYVTQALCLLAETRLCEHLPHFEQKREALVQAAQYDWTEIKTHIEAWVFLLYIMQEPSPEEVLKSWKLPNKTIKSIVQVLKFLYKRTGNNWDGMLLYEAKEDAAVMAETLYCVLSRTKAAPAVEKVRTAYWNLPIHDRKELQVAGKDLLQWSSKQAGPWVAEVLRGIERAVVCGQLENSKERIKEWLNRCSLL